MSETPQSPFEIDLAKIEALPEHERVEHLAALQQWQTIITANPLWRFLPHEGEAGWLKAQGKPVPEGTDRGQVEFLELNQRGVYIGAAVAGTRFGKTTINVADACIQTLPYSLVPPHLQPYKMLDPERKRREDPVHRA